MEAVINEVPRCTALMPHKTTIHKDVHQNHLKLVLKRIRWEKVRREAEEKGKGRKSQNKRNGEREKELNRRTSESLF